MSPADRSRTVALLLLGRFYSELNKHMAPETAAAARALLAQNPDAVRAAAAASAYAARNAARLQ